MLEYKNCPKCREKNESGKLYCSYCFYSFENADKTSSVNSPSLPDLKKTPQPSSPENYSLASEPVFFPVSPLKLAIMSIFTFGLYEVYWFYKNWKFLKKEKHLNISLFWRTVFYIFFVESLFKKIRDWAEENGNVRNFNPTLTAYYWLVLFVFSKLPDSWDPYGIFIFLSLFTFVPLIRAQKVINQLNQNKLEQVLNKKFSMWNIVIIIIIALYYLFMLYPLILTIYMLL